MRYRKDAPHPAEPRRVRQGRGLDMCDPFFVGACFVSVFVVCPSWSFFLLYFVGFALLFLVIVCGSFSCSLCDPRGRSSSSNYLVDFCFVILVPCVSLVVALPQFVDFCFVIFCSWCVARAREEEIERGSEGERKGVDIREVV